MLEDFIEANKLSAKIFEVRSGVHTAANAAAAMEVDADSVAKSILLLGSDGQPVLVVLLGKDRIDLQKVKAIMNVKDVALAGPGDVLQITGYEIGGVPPISIYGVTTLVDKAVAKKEEVVCGGGDKTHLMHIKVSEIIEFAEDARIEDVRK